MKTIKTEFTDDYDYNLSLPVITDDYKRKSMTHDNYRPITKLNKLKNIY